MDDHTLINMFGSTDAGLMMTRRHKPVRQVKHVPAHLSLITWSSRHVEFWHLMDSVSVSLQDSTWRAGVHVTWTRTKTETEVFCFFFSLWHPGRRRGHRAESKKNKTKKNTFFSPGRQQMEKSLAEILVNVDLFLRVSDITGGQNHGCKSETSKSRD